MSFITVLMIFFLILLIYKLITPSSRLRHYGNKIPGPKPYPVIGNSLNLLNVRSLLLLMTEFGNIYGPIFRLWLGKQLFITLTDPDDMAVILSSSNCLTKSDAYRFLESWLGKTNLVTSDGDTWQTHRKFLTPSFHFNILENSVAMILRHVEILCEKLEQCVDRSEFEIETFVEKMTLDIICETAMGIKLQTQRNGDTAYLECLKNTCVPLARRLFLPWLHPEPLFKIFKEGRIYFKNLKVLKAIGRKVIIERKKMLSEKGDSPQMKTGKKQPQPFLDFLLTESHFSDEDIENEVHVFMFAGHDTLKTAISFCLYEIAKHQDVQKKVVEEAKALLDHKEELTYQDLSNMKYLECVIKETMRIYPPITFFSRKLTTDMKVPSGYTLPTGAVVNFNVLSIHRNEKYFPDSLKFLPERFEQKNSTRNPYSYIPFSAGPRNCIGQKFAMLEMKLVLSTLLMKFQFLSVPEKEALLLESGLVIRSLNGLRVKVKRRNVNNI